MAVIAQGDQVARVRGLDGLGFRQELEGLTLSKESMKEDCMFGRLFLAMTGDDFNVQIDSWRGNSFTLPIEISKLSFVGDFRGQQGLLSPLKQSFLYKTAQ